MNEIKRISKQAQLIYEILIKGYFISDNSIMEETKSLYNLIEKEYDLLYEYFNVIGIALCKGEGFYYFAKESDKNTLEKKIEKAYKWLDLVDFFKTWNNAFTSGMRFIPAQIVEQIRVDVSLEEKLKNLQSFFKTPNLKISEKVMILIKALCDDGFMELENRNDELYKVLSAFNYLEDLITKIDIEEPEEDYELSQ